MWKCKNCMTANEDSALACTNCGADKENADEKTFTMIQRKNNPKIDMKRAMFVSLSVIFLALGCLFVSQGLDKKNNYYHFEDYPSLSKNAYVGGDAYNYIINAGYFAGYMALGGCMFICSTITLTSAMIMKTDGSKTAVQSVITLSDEQHKDQ